MTLWETTSKKHEILRPWTDVGLEWAAKYYVRMDDTDAYVLAMCKFIPGSLQQSDHLSFTVLNPAIRFTWIEAEWDEEYISRARKIILQRVSTTTRRKLYFTMAFADAHIS